MNRRQFLRTLGAAGSGLTMGARALARRPAGGPFLLEIPDEGWRMWPDTQAEWRDDRIWLPDDAVLGRMPVNPPTGGWAVLDDVLGLPVTLPATVEQYHWGLQGFRPYRDEYKFETTDNQVRNGSYLGVSWWWRPIEVPDRFAGKRVFLRVRAARQRAEVYLNGSLVGYSIMEELPFECDATAAVRPGRNLLAVRITNPGGRFDWVDSGRIFWGGISFQKSHGFGGLDRALALSAHGLARVADLWVLNTPDVRTVTAHATVDNASNRALSGMVRFAVFQARSRQPIASADVPVTVAAGKAQQVETPLTAPGADLWDLDAPHLHRLQATWMGEDSAVENDVKEVDFGFRWFEVAGLGSDAVFRLNGRRVRLYSSISWGYWALNGLFPTAELAEKEVRAARELGLNMLSFHRNLAKGEVLEAQDRIGLLRCLEPGGGLQAVSPPRAAGADSARRYMEAKILGMIRAHRSHPSVAYYILQNEARLPTFSPALAQIFERMHREDPSRAIVGNDGFVMRSPQAWEPAYGKGVRQSAGPATASGGAAGWWVDHTGHASDVWEDGYYNSPEDFLYRSTDRGEIVEWGEMKGAAASDDHEALVERIKRNGGASYDLRDHQEVLAAYERFLDRWGFRAAFPTAGSLFRSIGRRAYDSWGQFLENVRICDQNDVAVISGWESTAIENHSGIVDNFREFKGDPRTIRSSLLPVRPLAKQRRLVLQTGERAVFDLYLLNDSAAEAGGPLRFTLTDPAGRIFELGEFWAPKHRGEVFSYLVNAAVESPPLNSPGIWRSRFELKGRPNSAHVRELWVVDPFPADLPALRIGLADAPPQVAEALRALPGAQVETFAPGKRCDVIAAATIGEAVLAAVRAGTPLLAVCPSDGRAARLARALGNAGALQFDGMIGPSRASWMGSWYFVRAHPIYDGLPVDRAMSIQYQVKGGQSDGWRVAGDQVEIVAAYSRDHCRDIGAGTLATRLGATPIVMHCILGMHPVFARRLLANAVKWLVRQPLDGVARH